MRLTSLLSEGKAKFDYKNGRVEFMTSFKNGRIILLAKSSKDLDTIDDIMDAFGNPRLADENFRILTITRLKKKTGLDFESDPHHTGAGYAFVIKDDKLLKMLEATESDMNLKSILEGTLNEDAAMNKKVKQFLDKKLKDLSKGKPNHQWAVMHILMGALSDANFHSEAKQVAKLFPKAKYEGDPQGMKDLEEMYHYDFGPDVANICKWDGKDIVNAMGFYISMSIGRPLGQKVEALVENTGMRLFKESVYLKEAQYEVYHKSFTSAAEAAKKYAEKRGFEVDNDDWSTQIGMGGKNVRSRPSEGKTTEFTVGLLKGGKPQRKSLQIQVYGMKNGYELNVYIN